MSELFQVGVVGYDQLQITQNSGTIAATLPIGTVVVGPASVLPFYSVQAVCGQASFIMPAKNILLISSMNTNTRLRRALSAMPLFVAGS